MIEASKKEGDTVELSVIACQWSGYSKSINEAQADQIIAHLQQAFNKPTVLQFEMNGETYQTQGYRVTSTAPLHDGKEIEQDGCIFVEKDKNEQ